MSVLVPDEKVFEYVYQGLCRSACHSGQVDEWHNWKVYAFVRVDNPAPELYYTKIKRLVNAWVVLNDISYAIRYKEFDPWPPLSWSTSKDFKNICPYQLYQYLRCILYNIEMSTIEEMGPAPILTKQMKDDHQLLKDIIDAYCTNLLDMHPKIKDAKWSSV